MTEVRNVGLTEMTLSRAVILADSASPLGPFVVDNTEPAIPSLPPRPPINLSWASGHNRVHANLRDGITVELGVQEALQTHRGDRKKSVTADAVLHPADRKSLARPYISYVLFALCAVIYLLPFMRLIFIGGDEGSLVDGAVRILHGQVFARDFFEVMGPGTFYVLAGFLKLFGATFLVDRSWLFVTSLGTVLAMYFLSRRVCGKYQILPPILLVGVYFSTMWPMVNHHVDSNFFTLLSVVCMVLWLDTCRKGLSYSPRALLPE